MNCYNRFGSGIRIEFVCAKGELMTRQLWLLGVCLTLLAGGKADEPPAPHWFADFAEAQQQAKKTGKPLFVVFRCEH
jgi:hypothetical protein